MRLFKNIFLYKMQNTRHFKGKLLLGAFVFLVLLNLTVAESRTHVPARILAKQTGATQFEEEQYETHADCNDHKHHLKKRASDEDVDYEVYQGVVGRPGIDFPIYPRIPKTTFSCRSYGNGYFADMETDCQVFHICEEGRKISFLCPNGTIFQQSELTCDWWFKVNCLGSSGFYADSTELLNKQRVQRLRPSIPVQGFNIVGGGLNIKPRVPAKGTQRTRGNVNGSGNGNGNGNNKSDRRIDSDEAPSLESVDFDDLSGEKQRAGSVKPEISNIDNNDNENESQITAESASFVSNRNRNYNNYDKPKSEVNPKASSLRGDSPRRGAGDRGSQRHGYTDLNNDTTEKARNGQRGQQRYREDKKPETVDQSDRTKPLKKEKFADNNNEKLNSPTPSFNTGTYTTARRFESTRTTPFYTPTVPTVAKSKTTEGKNFYIKGATATTPAPNRFNLNNNGAGIFLQGGSGTVKPTANPIEFEITAPTTLRPIIIGMRHYYDGKDKDSSAEIFKVSPKTSFNVDLPLRKANTKYDSNEDIATTTPATTGPTYLPKSALSPKVTNDAAGDSFLFAPISVQQAEVSRNVNDMLKTINVLKHNFEDVELIKVNGKNRLGLDIPPSSGPDALISLAQYFAGDHHNDSNSKNVNSLEDNSNKKSSGKGNGGLNQSSNTIVPKEKPSDTTATLTTVATPGLAQNSDSIQSSLLSNGTVKRYNNLFGLNGASNSNTDPLKGLADPNAPKSKDVITPFPQIGATDSTIKALAEKPESRKIAQVFSNALTNYLNDPTKFRESLESVRPTEPSADKNSKFVTVTDSNLFNQGTGATYLPTQPTKASGFTTQSNLASAINSNFIASTIAPDSASTTEDFDSTTFKTSSEQKSSLEFSAELEPPTPDSGEGEEFLQREQTQSFVKPRNDLVRKQEKNGKLTTEKPSQNPWSFIEDDDVLDPLKINDGLMKSKTTTSSPFAYLPKDVTTILPRSSNHGNLQILSSSQQRSNLRHGSSELAESKPNSRLRLDTSAVDPWQEIFESYDLPRESLPSNSGLQRIANKLFGGLNENEAYHLRNVMAEAEHNRQILRLLLLLIQTCDDQNGKALERSRKHLINALINMDGKLKGDDSHSGKTSHHKEKPLTTTEILPVTTYRRTGSGEEITTTTLNYPSTTTDLPTTTLYGSTTIDSNGSGESTTTHKFVIKVEDNDKEASTLTTVAIDSDASSDKRALELLKSLYSLASKFTSRR